MSMLILLRRWRPSSTAGVAGAAATSVVIALCLSVWLSVVVVVSALLSCAVRSFPLRLPSPCALIPCFCSMPTFARLANSRSPSLRILAYYHLSRRPSSRLACSFPRASRSARPHSQRIIPLSCVHAHTSCLYFCTSPCYYFAHILSALRCHSLPAPFVPWPVPFVP